MSNFDNILNSLYSDIKAMTEEVGKKAEETIEVSKLNLERSKLKKRVQENYQRLGEIIYGGYKNEEDVSDVVAVLYKQLDEDFERIEDIYNEICSVKNGVDVYVTSEDFCGEEEENSAVEAVLYGEKDEEQLKTLCEAASGETEAETEAGEKESEETEKEAQAAVEKRRRALEKKSSNEIDVDAD